MGWPEGAGCAGGPRVFWGALRGYSGGAPGVACIMARRRYKVDAAKRVTDESVPEDLDSTPNLQPLIPNPPDL